MQSPKTHIVKTTKFVSTKKSSPTDLVRRNPNLYSHKKTAEVKQKKKWAALDETTDLFEIKDLDLKPNSYIRNL